EVAAHRRRRQDVGDEHRGPRERVQDRLGEEHRGDDEPELEEHEEHQDAEADTRLPLGERQQARHDAADRHEDQAVHPGEHEDHLEVGQDLGQRRRSAPPEERRAEHRRRVERSAAERVEDEEPDRDGRGADEAGDQALLIERRRRTLRNRLRVGAPGLPVRAPERARAAARRPAVAGRAATPGRLSERMMADGPGVPSEMSVIEDAERRGRTGRWPLWRQAYAQGDPLPQLTCRVSRPTYRFDEGEPLPGEYKELLIKMLRHEGERAGNKSFLGFMATCLDIAEALFPTAEAKLLKAEYLAEELKHAIMFHRVAVGLQHDFALRDVPYAHYAFHLPRETWADDAFFHFFVDLNGAFHARDWRESSYGPLAKMSAT